MNPNFFVPFVAIRLWPGLSGREWRLTRGRPDYASAAAKNAAKRGKNN